MALHRNKQAQYDTLIYLMKTIKTAFLFVVFLTTAVLYGCVGADDLPPSIEYGEFPFHFAYELKGKVYDIKDTIVCRYKGFDASNPFRKVRSWDIYLKNAHQPPFVFHKNYPYIFIFDDTHEDFSFMERHSRLVISLGGGYYMGEPNHDKPPYISYYNKRNEHKTITAKQMEELFDIKIIVSEFSSPINNTFE